MLAFVAEGNVFKVHLFTECVNTPFLLLPNDAGMMLQLLVFIIGVVLLFCYKNAAAVDMQTWGFFGRGGVFSVCWGIYEVRLWMW